MGDPTMYRVLRPFQYSPDGVSVSNLRSGQNVSIRSDLVNGLISAGLIRMAGAPGQIQGLQDVSGGKIVDHDIQTPLHNTDLETKEDKATEEDVFVSFDKMNRQELIEYLNMMRESFFRGAPDDKLREQAKAVALARLGMPSPVGG